MDIQVRLFSVLRQKSGQSQLNLPLPAGATVEDAREALGKAIPAISTDLAWVAWAVNAEYVPLDHALADGDELAVIPAVSGG